MDELHEVINGNIVSRTCVECGSVLIMSDYNMPVCTRCEEPQYNKTLDVLDKKIKKFTELKNGVKHFQTISLEEAIREYADYFAEYTVEAVRGNGVPFIRTFSEWVECEPFDGVKISGFPCGTCNEVFDDLDSREAHSMSCGN